MNILEMFQLNIFVALMLVILYGIIKYRLVIATFRRMILTHLTMLSLLGVVLEPIAWIVDGKMFFGAFFIEYASNFMLIFLAPMIVGFIMVYVDYYIYNDRQRIKRRYYYMFPALLSLILLVINIFYPIYFSVNPNDNIFRAENLYVIHYVILFGFFIYILIFIIRHWKLIDKEAKLIFVVFFALPIIGIIIQYFNSRVFFSWTLIAFAIFMMYVLLESTSGDTDYLTKLFSRQSFEDYIHELMEKSKTFGILYIDLNDFKAINDTYGHLMGDKVLISFANVLKEKLKPNKMISRLGGDEFIAVLEYNEDIKLTIKEINHRLKESRLSQMNTLSYSYGYSTFKDKVSMDDVYSVVDQQMYQFKRKHHQQA